MASIKIQNGYSTIISSTIPASGDFTVSLAQAPTESKGWITFDNANASLREYCYYDSKSGSTVFIKAVNRTNPQAHSIGASAQINNVAEMFQYLSDISSNFGYIEKKGGLAITVFGGVVKNENSFLTIADTNFTLSASQTTYVYFNILLNSFSVTLNLVEAQAGVPIATVITGASIVSTVTYTFPKLVVGSSTGGGGGSPFATDIIVNGYTVGRGPGDTNNVLLGFNSFISNTTGGANTIVGNGTLRDSVSGLANTAIGGAALQKALGSQNTGVGDSAGVSLVVGTKNTFIGTGADTLPSSVTNSTAIGSDAYVTASNQVVIGDPSVIQTILRGAVTATSFNGVTLTTGGGTTNFLRADGTYAAPAGSGSGDMLKSENLSGLASYPTARSNLGLGNVDNTSDANKPVSTATSTALNLKANLASPTFTGIVGLPSGQVVNGVTLTTGGGTTNFLRADGTYAAPAGGTGGSWTLVPGSPVRSSNIQFTLTDTGGANGFSSLLQRGCQIKWTESSAVRRAAVISASYASNTVTCNIVGDTMASIDVSSLRYHVTPWTLVKFQYPLTTAVLTDVCAPFQSDKAYRVYGARAYLTTVGVTGSSVYDINKNGTTMFTSKPTLGSGVSRSQDVSADNGASLTEFDTVTIDIDSISTVPGSGLTVDLYLGPAQLSNQV